MQTRFTFTKQKLLAIPTPDKRVIYHDESPKGQGLKLRVSPSGSKVFVLVRKLDGKPKYVRLGAFPLMTLEQARQAATSANVDLNQGTDPNAKKRAARAKGITLAEVLEQYIESRRTLRPNTVSKYRQLVRTYLSDWANRPIKDISRDKVEKRHRRISETSETSANATMRVLRALFEFAHGAYEDPNGEPMILHNPVKRLSHVRAWNKETRRSTVIKSADFPAWFDAVQTLPDWYGGADPETYRDYFLFVAFTGLRRREAAALRWAWIDLRHAVLTIPASETKNGHAHVLPLSDFLTDLLKRRAREGGEFVFPSATSAAGHLQEPKKAVDAIRRQSGVQFMLHDLRRTFITTAESLGIRDYTLKRLLNHRNAADVTDAYIVSDVERLREPMQQITDRLLLLARGGVDNVVVGDFGKVAV